MISIAVFPAIPLNVFFTRVPAYHSDVVTVVFSVLVCVGVPVCVSIGVPVGVPVGSSVWRSLSISAPTGVPVDVEVGLPFGGVLSPEVWGGFSVVGRRVGEIVVVPSLVTVPVMWDLFRFPYILWVAGAGTLVFPVALELEEFEVFVFL